MLILFLSNHCILSLVLNVLDQENNTEVCVANGCISENFDDIHLKLSKPAIFRCACTSCYLDTKILNIHFYNVITNELYGEAYYESSEACFPLLHTLTGPPGN